MTYEVLEHRPTASNGVTHHGRGGAGNTHHVSASDGTTSAHVRAGHLASGGKMSTGIGGAGNIRPAAERAMFSFDEELERRRLREERAAPVYHVGRGGAGNVEDTHRAAGSVRSGGSSVRSGADSAWERVSQTFTR
ncbi:MAG: hypothetical protein M1832_002585 [Thelocarpon impressellum]|nr:MAG: hypothetical protein M1832_002585 [Thelocarpon impressellum]